jgi:hypothetical protein
VERVAFLLEQTGERLGCLLNPESLIVRRTAGVRSRSGGRGSLTSAGLNDDPLLYTGGGITEMILDLLFDVTLDTSPAPAEDVRTLTRPLFELAEGKVAIDGVAQPPIVRFVWGKQWNVPGVVTAVAERLEQFTADGAPQRSWLRMRLVRVTEPNTDRALTEAPPLTLGQDLDISPELAEVHEVLGGGSADTSADEQGDVPGGERLDEIAFKRYGDCRFWRLIANFNGVENPLEIAAGRLLLLPPLSLSAPTPTADGNP